MAVVRTVCRGAGICVVLFVVAVGMTVIGAAVGGMVTR